MDELLKSVIFDKRILILGFGREGKASLNAIMRVGGFKSVTVADTRDVSADIPTGVGIVFGEGYMDTMDDYDLVFKSPGIVLNRDISEYTCEITSETEIFMQCFKDRIVGITGTKGKSTTSSLLNHVLKCAGKNVLFAGNIGIPVFEIADKIDNDTIVVLELSCHQLEYAKTAPHRAVLLNIYEDHLDHYGTREKYAKAKMNIYLCQNEGDVLYTTRETLENPMDAPSKVEYIDINDAPLSSFFEYPGITLRGEHNLLNAAFVYSIASEYGVSREEFINALVTFETLPHRLQFVCQKNGVDYYDDSISTTVKSAISAVKSIENAAILLVGGMERNIRYEELCEYLATSCLKYIICMYESGRRFYNMYNNMGVTSDTRPAIILTEDLYEAVKTAKEKSVKGDAVILSPAAASYGYFKNFEERGDVFANLVKNE